MGFVSEPRSGDLVRFGTCWLLAASTYLLSRASTIGQPPTRHFVSLRHEALSDSKIPNRVALLPPSRFEPKKPVADSHERLFFAMTAKVYAAAGLDLEETASLRPHFHEVDPLAKPFVGLPTPAYYVGGALFATGENWLGWKMARSLRWHKI